MTIEKSYNVLFLCTGNSARSIIGEVLVTHWGKGRFHGFSAGSQPKGAVHPLTLEMLNGLKLPTENLRSKSWSEFAQPDAPGQPMTAHWGVSDPAAVEGSPAQQLAAFRDTYRRLDARIKLFLSLPFDKLNRFGLQQEANRIGRTNDTAEVKTEIS